MLSRHRSVSLFHVTDDAVGPCVFRPDQSVVREWVRPLRVSCAKGISALTGHCAGDNAGTQWHTFCGRVKHFASFGACARIWDVKAQWLTPLTTFVTASLAWRDPYMFPSCYRHIADIRSPRDPLNRVHRAFCSSPFRCLHIQGIVMFKRAFTRLMMHDSFFSSIHADWLCVGERVCEKQERWYRIGGQGRACETATDRQMGMGGWVGVKVQGTETNEEWVRLPTEEKLHWGNSIDSSSSGRCLAVQETYCDA